MFEPATDVDPKQAICSYLEQCTPYLHPSHLHSLQASLAQDNTSPSLLRVRELISRRLYDISNTSRPPTVLGKRKRGNTPMPESAGVLLEQMGCGSRSSMDIDEGWKMHVIHELKDSFLRYVSPQVIAAIAHERSGPSLILLQKTASLLPRDSSSSSRTLTVKVKPVAARLL